MFGKHTSMHKLPPTSQSNNDRLDLWDLFELFYCCSNLSLGYFTIIGDGARKSTLFSFAGDGASYPFM